MRGAEEEAAAAAARQAEEKAVVAAAAAAAAVREAEEKAAAEAKAAEQRAQEEALAKARAEAAEAAEAEAKAAAAVAEAEAAEAAEARAAAEWESAQVAIGLVQAARMLVDREGRRAAEAAPVAPRTDQMTPGQWETPPVPRNLARELSAAERPASRTIRRLENTAAGILASATRDVTGPGTQVLGGGGDGNDTFEGASWQQREPRQEPERPSRPRTAPPSPRVARNGAATTNTSGQHAASPREAPHALTHAAAHTQGTAPIQAVSAAPATGGRRAQRPASAAASRAPRESSARSLPHVRGAQHAGSQMVLQMLRSKMPLTESALKHAANDFQAFTPWQPQPTPH